MLQRQSNKNNHDYLLTEILLALFSFKNINTVVLPRLSTNIKHDNFIVT